MTGNDVFNFSVYMAEPSSIVTEGIPFHTNFTPLNSPDLMVLNNRDQAVNGFPGPLTVHGDENNLEASAHGTILGRISDSYPTGIVSLERYISRDLLYGTPYPTSVETKGRYMEGMPLSAASLSNLCIPHETLNRYASSTPLIYPSDVPGNVNPSDNSNTSNDNVPTHSSTRWDFNNYVLHPEPSGKVLGRTTLQPFGIMQTVDPGRWVGSQNTSLSSDSPRSSRLSNELSLSLATSNPSVLCRNSIQDHCSEICGSSTSPYERCLGSEQTSCSRKTSLSFGSSKPIQISQLLSGSLYLHAIQEILSEVAFYALGNHDQMNYSTFGFEDQENASLSSTCAAKVTIEADPMMQQLEVETKKKHLLDLLQVVDDQYSQCLDEIHTVVAAFHAVTELNPDIHARFALKTISTLYKSLRERISNHILALGVYCSKEVARKEGKSFETSFIQKQFALQQLKRKDNQIWRPQRGLPERSVSVLRAWMFQNFLHPYPKDAEKHLLAVKSGLTRSQVSNWFINARVRLWKPMIEEMYAEMNRRKNHQTDEETNHNNSNSQRNRIRINNQRFAMF